MYGCCMDTPIFIDQCHQQRRVYRGIEITPSFYWALSHRSFVLYGSLLHIFAISPLCMRLLIGALAKSKLQVVFNSPKFFRQSPCGPYSPNLFTAKVFLHKVAICVHALSNKYMFV